MRTCSLTMLRPVHSHNSLLPLLTYAIVISMTVLMRLHSPANIWITSSPFSNTFHPALELSCTVFNSSVEILDISVNIHHSTLTTFIHYKHIYSLILTSITLLTPSSPSTTPNSSVYANPALTDLTLRPNINSSYVDILSPLSTLPLPGDNSWTVPMFFLLTYALSLHVSRFPSPTTLLLPPMHLRVSYLSILTTYKYPYTTIN